MNEEEDQFYVEPEEEHVRQIQQLEPPVPTYQKPASVEPPKNANLKILEIPKEKHYEYQSFKLKKPNIESEEEEDQNYVQEYESPFTEFYSLEQLVYKKFHNENIAKFRQTFYFAGSFVHRNIFSTTDKIESDQLSSIARQYYQIPEQELPQDRLKEGDLLFDSNFESGNLFAAFKVSHSEYDLVMQMDTNSRGNNQWFYFSVQRMEQGKEYTFNVINFTKNDALFNYGMQPAVFSVQESLKAKVPEMSWKRIGLEVSYKKGQIPRQNSRRFFYKLSFKLVPKFANDKLFVAHSYPYSYSKVLEYIESKCAQNKALCSRITIGKTVSKRPIEVLKITSQTKMKKDNRKAIIITARQHPGQTQGSFVCQGTIDKVLTKSKEAEFLRKNYVFYIIPMINIDGVVYGHYRTNMMGKDLNRKWDISEKETSCPEVVYVKSFLSELSKQRQIRFILDLHGHSKKLNSFFYGNPCQQNPDVVRIYPFACSKISPAIQFYDCTFSSDEGKRKAARVYLSFLYRQIHVYTFESSFYAYVKDGKKIEFTPNEYRDLGGSLITALSLQLEHEVRYQQSHEFNLGKNTNKEFLNSPFVKMLTELKQTRGLLDIGNHQTSGSESRPEDGQIDQNEVSSIRPLKISRPPSINLQEESRSLRQSRKGVREIKQMNRPTRNMKFLEISKINSVLPDKYQLCLQPMKLEPQRSANDSMKSTSSIARMKLNCDTQTERQKNEQQYKQFKKSELQESKLSMSVKIEDKNQRSSTDRRYSSVIRTQNRNNIIFKIDFMNQETRQQKIANIKKISKTINLKHAFSQTIISFKSEREKEKQRLKEEQKLLQEEKLRSSSNFLPSVETPDRDEKTWSRNNKIKYDTVRIASKRQAQIFLNGVVKKYVGEKGSQPPKSESLSIFCKALERPRSLRKKDSMSRR